MTEIEPQAVPDPVTTDWVPIWSVGPAIPATQPSVRVARTGTAFSVPSGAFTAIQFNTVRYDVGPFAHWAAGNPTRLTCQVAGTYAIWAGAQFTPSNNGNTRQILIVKNGTMYIGTGGLSGNSFAGGGYPPASTPVLVQLSVGEYIEAQAYQDTGAALNMNTSDNAGSQHACEFAMAMLGGMQGPPGQAATYGVNLPSSPVDGQEHVLVDSVTNPSYQWRFRYNANSSSPYKWEFVGGPPMTGWVSAGAALTTAWASYAPSLVVPRSGEYLASFGAGNITMPSGSGSPYLGIGLWLGGYVSGSESYINISPGQNSHIAVTDWGPGPWALTSGATVSLAATASVTGPNISYRRLALTPVRVA